MIKKFRCIKELEIYLSNVNRFETGYCEIVPLVVPLGSIWELDTEIACGENHLESIDLSTHLSWIEIDDKALKEYFEEV